LTITEIGSIWMEVNQPFESVIERQQNLLQYWLEINGYPTKKNQPCVGSRLTRYSGYLYLLFGGYIGKTEACFGCPQL
jgi:hypothetical protein